MNSNAVMNAIFNWLLEHYLVLSAMSQKCFARRHKIHVDSVIGFGFPKIRPSDKSTVYKFFMSLAISIALFTGTLFPLAFAPLPQIRRKVFQNIHLPIHIRNVT